MHWSWECTWSFWFPGICGSFSKPLLSKDSHPLAFPPNLFGVLFAPTVIHCLMQHQLINFLLINVFNKLLPSSHFLALANSELGKIKSPFVPVFQGTTRQVKTNYYNSLWMRSFCALWYCYWYQEGRLIFKTTTELENGEMPQSSLC